MQRISTEILANANQQTPAIDGPGPSERSFVEALVDPASVFRDPEEVVHHPWLTHQEKRTILLSWARDELVAEQVTSRLAPELRVRSRIDAVVEALATFDDAAAVEYTSAVAVIRSAAGRPGRVRH